MRIALTIAFVALSALFATAPASAEKRVALVIGNGAYKNASKLSNPTNDAKAIAGMLQTAGFDAVELHENLGIREMRQAIVDFSDIARDADTAIVYYSGHGIEVNGINYLIPVDAALNRDVDVPYETYSLDNLVQVLEPARRLRLIMLDACRDNPFVRSMKRTVGSRAVSRGLAAVEPASVNTLIAYAAKAGSYALDGDGTNSPYATAVLNNLAIPGLDLRIAFGRVRDDVLKMTKNRQEPFVYGSLGGTNVSIVVSSAPSDSSATLPAQPSSIPVDRAAQAWGVIQNTTSIAVIEDFIRQYGSTSYGSMARARLEELKKSQVAATPPQQPVSPPAQTGEAAQAWTVIQNTQSITVLEAFIVRFPGTFYADLARGRIEELKKSQVAVATPPPPKAQDKGASEARSIQPGQKGCGAISGTWMWVNNRDVTFRPNGTMQATDGSIAGNWKCEDGLYTLTWNHGYTDRVRLSGDGRQLSGSNNIGFPVTATRRVTASASREAPNGKPAEPQPESQGGIGGLLNGVLKGAGDIVGGVLGGGANQQPAESRP
jgi:uncharacterized caspase-like protein